MQTCIPQGSTVSGGQVWIALLLIAVCYNPRNGNTLLFHSAQVLVPELYKILISGHTCMPHKQHCLPPLLNSASWHYKSAVSLWLVFPASVQHGRALEHSFVVPNNMSMHCHTHQKYTGDVHVQNPDGSIFHRCTSSPYGIHIRTALDCQNYVTTGNGGLGYYVMHTTKKDWLF